MSELDGDLQPLIDKLSALSNLSKETVGEIKEYLDKESNGIVSQNIRDKLSTLTNTLNDGISYISSTCSELLNCKPTTDTSKQDEESSDKIQNAPEQEDTTVKDEIPEPVTRPLLKIVDFSKLVDPRSLELMDKNYERKQRIKNASIIILSSSEDESFEKKTSSVNHASNQRIVKVGGGQVQKSSRTVAPKVKPVSVKICSVNLTKQSVNRAASRLQKNKAEISKTSKDTQSNINKQIVENDWKFKSKPYVRLLRIPCEDMKSYYSNQSCDSEENMLKKKNSGPFLDEKSGEFIIESSSDEGETLINKVSQTKKTSHSNKNRKKVDDTSEEEIESSERRRRAISHQKKRVNEGRKNIRSTKDKGVSSDEDMISSKKSNSRTEKNKVRNGEGIFTSSDEGENKKITKKSDEKSQNPANAKKREKFKEKKTDEKEDKEEPVEKQSLEGNILPANKKRSDCDKGSSEDDSNDPLKLNKSKETEPNTQNQISEIESIDKNENSAEKDVSNDEGTGQKEKEGNKNKSDKSEVKRIKSTTNNSEKLNETKQKSQCKETKENQEENKTSDLEKRTKDSKKKDSADNDLNKDTVNEETEKSVPEKASNTDGAEESIIEDKENETTDAEKDSEKYKNKKTNKNSKAKSQAKNNKRIEDEGCSSDEKENKESETEPSTQFNGSIEKDSEEDSNLRKNLNLSDEEECAKDEEDKTDCSDSDFGVKKKRKKSKYSEDEDVVSIKSDDWHSDDSDFAALPKINAKSKKSKRRMKRLSSGSEENKSDRDGNSGNDSDKEENNDSSDAASDKEKETTVNAKRKRIRAATDKSSDSDETITTRKKIKKVISKNSLSEQTKKAAEEEKERKHRISEKQKKYNQIYESSELASSTVEKLILDVDEKTEKPLLEVDKSLVSKLKPHQASGIQFMWDACFESLQRAKESTGSGCILAHCMGLGKTLQVITLTNTLLQASKKTKIRTVLIVTPLSTVLNWKAEYKNWLSGDEDYEVYELTTVSRASERASCLKQWQESGGIMIVSYAMFRNLSNEKNKRFSKKVRALFAETLLDPGPDLVICDEGHLLKNEKTHLSVAMNKIKTRRRIVLTGTPLQNNLKEYYCMVQFVKPNLLGTYREYLNRFVNPITNGQYTDSTQYDINIMRRRSHVLHKLLDGIVQRRDYSVLSPYLPPKFEYVLFLTLTDVQKKLYSYYMENLAKQDSSGKTSYLFQDFQALTRICIHPRVLLDKSTDDQQKIRESDEESIGSLKNFIDDDNESTSESSESSSESGSQSDAPKKTKKRKGRRITRAQAARSDHDDESEEEVVMSEEQKEWWQQFCDGEELDNIAHSTKLTLLFEILKECEVIGDKVLLFSQSLYALNVIEYFLEKIDEATQNGTADETTCGYKGSWTPGLDYFRLDGSTNCNLRSAWCDSFNKESNTRARLFLLSTRAGGLGINLVGANRVIIFDVSWNPSSDIQSIYRVYRFGQLKPSYIYRFVVFGTMEMKIYERQVTKQAISKRVIDEQQIDRHYNQNDLAELYKFEIPDQEDRPIPLVPKDVLLGEMLQNHEDKIFKYHEHQSLLENKEDETLNEEERKAAWDEFENEKVERTKQQGVIGQFSLSTVQLALKNIIQRDNPSWNKNQIVSIIPQLLQQLNLQLSTGDNTMYNKIAQEVRIMQEEYARKMQMQFNQYRMKMAAQRQQQQMGYYNMAQNPFYNQFQQFMMGGNRLPAPGPSTLNPNDVVELN